MKVGIITITTGANYGNRLQHFAVRTILEKLGCETITISNAGNCPPLKEKIYTSITGIIKRALKKSNYLYLNRRNKFENFNDKYFEFSKEVVRDKDFNCNNYDFLVCGSDQIWNLNFWFTRIGYRYYFAEFAPKEKRIAYSASIGSENIPDECTADFIRLVQEMKAISAREENARDVIKTLTGRDVPVTVDPTLMLSKSEWLEIAKKPKYVKKNERFILTYFLGEYSSEVEAYITTISQTYNFQVINLYNEYIEPSKIKNKDYFCTDPSEFIWLISNCELVMTDSFHGCVFSMIMDKPFRCFKRQDSAEDMSSRMDTLFKKFNVSDWCIGDINEDIEHVFYKDYSGFESTLKKEQDFAYDYLKGALDIK